MGCKSSQNVAPEEKQPKKNMKFTFYKSEFDERYGSIRLVKDETGLPIVVKDFSHSEEIAARLVEDLRDRLFNQHLRIQRLVHFDVQKSSGRNSETKITCFFEYIEGGLEAEIRRRRERQEFFAESEIYTILNAITEACLFLQRHGMTHEDICPSNILLTRDFDVKLSDPLLRMNGLSQFMQIAQGLIELPEGCYLSPGLFRARWEQQHIPKSVNLYKSDVFSLGLTLLKALSLQNVSEIYDFNSGIVDFRRLESILQYASWRYSQGLMSTIRAMLAPNDEARPDFEQLEKWIAAQRGGRTVQIPQQQQAPYAPPESIHQYQPQIQTPIQLQPHQSPNPQHLQPRIQLQPAVSPSQPQNHHHLPPLIPQPHILAQPQFQAQTYEVKPAYEVRHETKPTYETRQQTYEVKPAATYQYTQAAPLSERTSSQRELIVAPPLYHQPKVHTMEDLGKENVGKVTIVQSGQLNTRHSSLPDFDLLELRISEVLKRSERNIQRYKI
eukprot:TRINITY_DN1946_c0_g1_i7.p1 TRINITY_DN1946_c0_g1~~TRINITY_DN1946_c0_g1_i7.p1  ORF type:complete len:499 (+),score=111.15 TRINITY_DN1946_c0_g1_i7:166-1662(+)